jgi:hypothetical protein
MSGRRAVQALFWRDLLVISRRRSMLTAVAVHVVLLASFLLAWSDVVLVPLLPGNNLYEQLRAAQSALVAVMLPWIVCRFLSAESGHSWTLLSLATGLSASRLFDVRFLALATFAAVLAGSGFPLMLLAQQMSSVPARTLLADACSLFFFALAATILTLSIASTLRGPIAGWLASSLAAVTLRAFVQDGRPGTSALTAAAAIVVALALAESPAAWPRLRGRWA